jgi:hypothetical protein
MLHWDQLLVVPVCREHILHPPLERLITLLPPAGIHATKEVVPSQPHSTNQIDCIAVVRCLLLR